MRGIWAKPMRDLHHDFTDAESELFKGGCIGDYKDI